MKMTQRTRKERATLFTRKMMHLIFLAAAISAIAMSAQATQPQVPTSSIARPATGQPFPPSSSLATPVPTQQPPPMSSIADPANQIPSTAGPIVAPQQQQVGPNNNGSTSGTTAAPDNGLGGPAGVTIDQINRENSQGQSNQ